MMRSLLAYVLVAATTTVASAQPLPSRPTGQPPTRPTVSPYLNLLRGGTNPAINYYGLVRPQFEFSRQMRQVESELASQEHTLRGLEEETGVAATGHAAGFMNYLHYYNFGDQRSSFGGGTVSRSTGRRSSTSRTSVISTAPINVSRPTTSPPAPTPPE
jgi:hypothetical protein